MLLFHLCKQFVLSDNLTFLAGLGVERGNLRAQPVYFLTAIDSRPYVMTIEFSERDLGKHGIPHHVEVETVQGETLDVLRLQQASLLADRDIARPAIDNHCLVGRRIAHQAHGTLWHPLALGIDL